MRLFRQTKTRDYVDVAGRVRTELLELIAARPALGRVNGFGFAKPLK
jgi:hypothetical protein